MGFSIIYYFVIGQVFIKFLICFFYSIFCYLKSCLHAYLNYFIQSQLIQQIVLLIEGHVHLNFKHHMKVQIRKTKITFLYFPTTRFESYYWVKYPFFHLVYSTTFFQHSKAILNLSLRTMKYYLKLLVLSSFIHFLLHLWIHFKNFV